MSADSDKKSLNDLRVVDLKSELEKRGKDNSGVKSVLIERLSQALKDDDENPETYIFDLSAKVSPVKKAPPRASNNTTEGDSAEEKNGNGEDEDHIDLDGFVVKDELNEQDEEADETKKADTDKDKNEGKPKVEAKKVEAKPKTGANQETTNHEAKEVDNEDSLNLTIGEEDEKLLHDNNIENEKKDDTVKHSEANDNNGSNELGDEKKSAGDKDSGKKKPDDKAEKSEDKKKSDETKSNDKSDKTSSSKTVNKDEKDSSTKISTASSKSDSGKSKSSPNSNSVSSAVSRNLWVSGLSSLTRATDLKQIFSKYGKVIGAKVVTNTRTPGTRCYGYVTMASAKDATECITHLHRTELHGRMISVERAKSDLGPSKPPAESKDNKETASKTSTKKEDDSSTKSRHDDRKKSPSKDEATKDAKPRTKSADAKKDDGKTAPGDKKKIDDLARKPARDTNIKRIVPPASAARRSRERDTLSYQKIREERDRQRLREKERELREEERRRREIRRRQREEEQRLHREREKLAQERARIEKEKAELLRIERERQKLEREKIELERLELKRQQRKIEEAKRSLKRPANDRPHDDDYRKRAAIPERRFEAPPPPRFETAISSHSYNIESKSKKEDIKQYLSAAIDMNHHLEDIALGSHKSRPSQYDRVSSSDSKKRIDDYSTSKRDEYTSSKRDDYKAREEYKTRADDYKRESYKRPDEYKREMEQRHVATAYDSRGSGGLPPSHRVESNIVLSKEPRYSDRPSSDFRRAADERDGHRNSSSGKPRYMESQSDSRYAERSGGSSSANWHNSGPPQVMSVASNNDAWNKPSDSGWRSLDANQDRYDRTYNERKAVPMSAVSSGFLDPARQAQFIARPQDRYNNTVSSRFENGRY